MQTSGPTQNQNPNPNPGPKPHLLQPLRSLSCWQPVQLLKVLRQGGHVARERCAGLIQQHGVQVGGLGLIKRQILSGTKVKGHALDKSAIILQ